MTDWQTESIQLDNLFKQPQVLLLFAELQLDVGRNNSVLSVTCSHRTMQSLGLDGSSGDRPVQPPAQSRLFRVMSSQV